MKQPSFDPALNDLAGLNEKYIVLLFILVSYCDK